LWEIYHNTSINHPTVFNISIARQVWDLNPVLAYDSVLVDNEYRGEEDSCGIEPFALPSTPIGAPQWTLYHDSGMIVTYKDGLGVSRPYSDAINLFTAFQAPASDTIPVFVMPVLYELLADGSIVPRGIEGISFDPGAGALSPSIWINAILNYQHNIPSVVAHELAHILLDVQAPPLWGDNSTEFLHIQTNTGFAKLTRASTSPGATTNVIANDINRRTLISYNGRSACREAQFSPYVRLEVVGS